MSKLKEFLVRKDIVISPQRYLIDALGAMAQGLFASLLIGTIIKTESDDLAFDHELILADAIVQLRKWITETHIAFRLLPEKFTLRELQQIHETVLDTKLLVPAFRRKVADLVEDTGEMTGDAGHRPAKLYREKR